MFFEKSAVIGHVSMQLYGADGRLKDSIEHHNLVVNVGLAAMAARLHNDAEGKITHIAVGASSTAAAAGQTALVAEVNRQAISAATAVTTLVTDDSVQYAATFAPGQGTGSLKEAGLVTASKMWCRVTFGEFNKEAGDTLTVTWVIQMKN